MDMESNSKYVKPSTVDDIESGSDSMEPVVIDEVYNRYDFKRNLPDLPIVEMRTKILKAIEDNPIVILEGATGCGKSTQVDFIH